MSPGRVRSWDEVEAWLRSKHFVPTNDLYPGGRFWRSKSKRHLMVPDAIDGFYPEFFWADLVQRANDIIP